MYTDLKLVTSEWNKSISFKKAFRYTHALGGDKKHLNMEMSGDTLEYLTQALSLAWMPTEIISVPRLSQPT